MGKFDSDKILDLGELENDFELAQATSLYIELVQGSDLRVLVKPDPSGQRPTHAIGDEWACNTFDPVESMD